MRIERALRLGITRRIDERDTSLRCKRSLRKKVDGEISRPDNERVVRVSVALRLGMIFQIFAAARGLEHDRRDSQAGCELPECVTRPSAICRWANDNKWALRFCEAAGDLLQEL